MTHVDFFSGIGGFSLAAQRVWGDEWKCVGHSEIDKNACKIYHKHFPKSQCLGAIEGVKKLDADLITAGFPCQDLSVAGRRAGLQGARSGLFWHLAEHIRRVKPRWFVLENVPGLLSSNKGGDMCAVISSLEEIGYCVAWRVLNAKYFGVAQRRRRVWIVGSFGNISAAKVLFERKSCLGYDKSLSKVGERGLCINTRSGGRFDPTAETYVAATIGATPRGNTSFVWQDTYIAEIDNNRERKIDGVSRGMDGIRGKGLGNAIVPQVAEAIFKRIKYYDKIIKEVNNERNRNSK